MDLREIGRYGHSGSLEGYIDLSQSSFERLSVPGEAADQVRRREDFVNAQPRHAPDGRERGVEVASSVVDPRDEMTVNLKEKKIVYPARVTSTPCVTIC